MLATGSILRNLEDAEFKQSECYIFIDSGQSSIMKRLTGQVLWFSPEKGFGFIACYDTPVGKAEIFVNYSSIQSEGFRTLGKGQEVEFDLATDDRGYFAKKVKVL